MKKKYLILFIALAAALHALPAASFSDIISGAKNVSPTYQNILITYENSLISIRNQEAEDKIGITVNGSVNPLLDKGDEKGINASSDVSLTLPGDGKTSITAGLNGTTYYDGSSQSITPSIGASHTFDFTGYSSSDASDISLAQNKYSTELTRKSAELNFEKSVISTISTVLSYEKNLGKAKRTLENQKTLMEKMDTLGTYSTSSPTYISAKNTLTQAEASYSAALTQYENAKANFTDLTGLEWTGVEDLPDPVLDLKTYQGGNTSVLLKSLSVSASEEEYKAKKASLEPSSLYLSGSLSGTISSSSSLTLGGTVKYTGPSWSVTATPRVTINENKTTPSLTISGSWSKVGSSSDTLLSYENKVKSAENDYVSALSSYSEEAQSLSLRILNWESGMDSARNTLEYQKMLLENEKLMFSLGLSTKTDVEKAELEVLSAEYDLKTKTLEGLSLERDLEIFAL